ncbi:SHOCT domain-containing protein [Haloarcula sp. 1CSR25-25]|nr:SHOCT domain-containing protein [Haloarcula sp. 1CSR25-25]
MHGGRGRGLRGLFGGGMMGHGHGRHGGRSGCSSHHSSHESTPSTESSEAGSSEEPAGSDRALAILRERYARGEIDEEEFETRRNTLREIK